MATITGFTAEKMQEIIDDTVASAAIVGSSLVFTKHDGSTFNAGDFAAYIGSQVSTSVSSAVASAVPPAVAGGVTEKGNQTGTIDLKTSPVMTNSQMVNRIFRMTLTGNITINASSFPASHLPATQFAIVMKQDATGGRTLSLSGIKRSQGVLTLSTAPNAIDIISFMYDGTDWFAGAMGVAFS